MTMTKAEKAEMEALRKARDLARALRWPEYAEPAPLSESEIRDNLTFEMPSRYEGFDRQRACRGWIAYSRSSFHFDPKVEQHFSNGINNTSDPKGKSWSQGMGRIYGSPLKAIQALRHEFTADYAARLAKLDQMIADTEGVTSDRG